MTGTLKTSDHGVDVCDDVVSDAVSGVGGDAGVHVVHVFAGRGPGGKPAAKPMLVVHETLSYMTFLVRHLAPNYLTNGFGLIPGSSACYRPSGLAIG
jgi:hypothetical protein